jgi:hypothetical protein
VFEARAYILLVFVIFSCFLLTLLASLGVCALTLLRRRCPTVALFRAGRLSQQLAVHIICCKCICSTLISGPKSSAHCCGCFHIEFVLTLFMLLVHHKGDSHHRVCTRGGLLDRTKGDSDCPVYSATPMDTASASASTSRGAQAGLELLFAMPPL